MDRIARALELALGGHWEDARRALEGVDDHLVSRLQTVFDELARCAAERTRARADVRHDVSNLMTVAQANVEGMLDGIVEPTPQKLENVRRALASAAALMSERVSDRESGSARIEELLVARCPYSSARNFLESDMLAEPGRPRLLRLEVPLAGVRVAKNVAVTIAPGTDPMHLDQPWQVRWSPEGGGPYPDFDGELTVRADEDWNSSLLELRGTYAPPGGALGTLFDRALGNRIASATAQSLLRNVADSLESRYRAQEESKRDAPGPV